MSGITGTPVATQPAASSTTAPHRPRKEPRISTASQDRRGPTADCTADIAGGLTFDVRLSDDAAAGQESPGLLLRRRPDLSGETEEIRLPLAPVEDARPAREGTGLVLRAALPSTVQMTEGRWNVFLALEGQEPRRLAPGLNDLRSLVDRTPREGRTWLGVRIPYATKHGNLSVRAWQRWPHAEAGTLRVVDNGLVLNGRLHGARLDTGARLEARPRRAGGAAGTVHVEVAVDGEEFTAELPYPPLAVHRLWDLWLRPAEGVDAVRVARILDDIPDKKRIFTYPAQRIELPPGAEKPEPCTATPYYTLNNDLAVRVDPVSA
ncbi:hypothetical protein [Streptomyces cacaoi]|uniref:hypothetical protein n=1 Tax=Streptomyces cacaoi TaxID=1898 RepID=UPI0026297C7E|nr:hypothetical protein [Streptomyces cacaoi]